MEKLDELKAWLEKKIADEKASFATSGLYEDDGGASRIHLTRSHAYAIVLERMKNLQGDRHGS